MNIGILKAQTIQKEKQSLAEVLKILETKYNIRFSYADVTITDKMLALPDSNLSMEDAINLLKTETNLSFEILDNRFVVIKVFDTYSDSITTQRLEEITITNYLTKGITQLNDGTTTIKPETFGILPGLIEPDILQTIQALPGILSVDETVSNINVRGGTHDQNLFLWDGIKMYQSGHFFGLISSFNPYTTKRVNVFKNGTRAKYGDGISSVIDMQLSNKIDHEFKAGVGFNLINADAFAKIPLSKKTELQLSTRRSITDLMVTPTYDQYFKRIFQDSDLTSTKDDSYSISQNEDFYFYDITAKFLYNITKSDKVRVHFLQVNNDLNYDEQSTINDTNEALNSRLSQQNLAVGITYTKNWSERLSTTSQVYVSKYNLDATNFDVLNNQRLIQENEVQDGSAKFDINYIASQNVNINGGYQFSEIGVANLEDVNNPDFRSYIKEVIRSHAIYAESSWLSNNANSHLKFGTRVNYHKKFEMFLVEPRFSFSQRFFNHFRFEILGELKSQTTSQIIDLQNDFLGIEKRRWMLSDNENIPVIKSKQISIGIHFNKNKLLISAEAYIKYVDGITTRSQGFQNQYQFVNAVGSYQIKGVDFLLNKQFNDLISTWFSYTYSKNDYTFKTLNNGNPFPNNADIRHAISLAGTYTYNNIKLALGLNWHSGKPNTTPVLNNEVVDGLIQYEPPNSSNLKDYLRADFSTTYEFNISDHTRAILGTSIWNITNKKNILNTYYTLENQDMVSKVENQSLGITPNLSFRLQF
ncbi:MAG: TonB-dependent receptor plug domain-containing protein [Flavobacteriales bacterium]|nr:TonB-dependent receptor plug domain-containing protein [Flavobacteriia bacterium]NCP52271.1 TonB-dependent receptor plug domain-containing protein [Flavobacteriales bacterium]NCP60421.1 TonB-dependent receptor plug domain-containing protein [Flavobacteriales bacterium]NCT16024.1 TonB-dependent receptor plug domain-containing protein [Flavobacteriales bacterium]PIV95109.1 MAG: TonB-dependent receptor [Flavobacteriaceae bacterium CG17_big_fil_post_rev_8_21_14_2_50_33_15]